MPNVLDRDMILANRRLPNPERCAGEVTRTSDI